MNTLEGMDRFIHSFKLWVIIFMGLGCIVSAGIMAKMIAQTNVMVIELTIQTAQKTQAINALRQQLKNCPSGRSPMNTPRSAEYRVDKPSWRAYNPKTLKF